MRQIFPPQTPKIMLRFKRHEAEGRQGVLLAARCCRALCRSAILKYVPKSAPKKYRHRLDVQRELVRGHIARLMGEWGRP